MSVGLTPSQIEQWVKLDAANTINTNGVFFYRIAANLPPQIIDLLLSRQSENQFYFGSTLRVTKTVDQTFYNLGFYTLAAATDDFSQFVIGRTTYELRNFSVDYQPYLNSSNYINLDISFNNLDLSGNYFNQAILAGDIFGYTQINQNFDFIASTTGIFLDDKTLLFQAVDDLPTNFFSTIPTASFSKFSITPSILRLAQGYSFGAAEDAKSIFGSVNEKTKSAKKTLKEAKSKININSL